MQNVTMLGGFFGNLFLPLLRESSAETFLTLIHYLEQNSVWDILKAPMRKMIRNADTL